MRPIIKEKLNKWENETDEVTHLFIIKYFGRDADFYWVADIVGGVLYVNDYFFNLDRILEALKYNASAAKLFAYYEYELEHYSVDRDPMPINFKNFLKIK